MQRHFAPKTLFVALLLTIVPHDYARAAADKSTIIANVIKAYGGERLIDMKGIKVADKYKALFTKQGVQPNFTEVYKYNISLVADFQHSRKSLTQWEQKVRGDRLTREVFDGKKGRIYDLYHNTVETADYLNFDNVGASVNRYYDTFLARKLWQQNSSAELLGDATYHNKTHYLIGITSGSEQAETLFIDPESWLISKMTRMHPTLGEVTYTYSNYKVSDGVTYASDFYLSVNGAPQVISVSREIQVNPTFTDEFELSKQFKQSETMKEINDMKVQTIADGVYHVGQGFAYSVFVSTGSYFIAAGGNPGLLARFNALKDYLRVELPLKYQVVTHHHSDHLAGMNDAARLGATFITLEEHKPALEQSIDSDRNESQINVVGRFTQMESGLIELYDMPSTHSAHNLVMFLPKAKVLFVADHFSTNLATQLPHADKGTLILQQMVAQHGLKADYFLSAHGRRVLTNSELNTAVKRYQEPVCPPNVAVCMD